MKHLRLANGRGPGVTAGRSQRDICLVDYSGCSLSDTCWLMDFESDCVSHDGCIVDTT